MTKIQETGAFKGMVELGVPPGTAAVKVQSTRRGALFVALGALLVVGAFAFVIYTMKITQGAPGLSMLIFAALLGLPGAYFLLAGGHLIAGDAMRAAEGSGSVIARTAARALRLTRPKDP